MNKYYSFLAKDMPEIEEVGGKAPSLINTTKAGFNVPQGFVLCMEYFKYWFEEIFDSKDWNNFLNSEEYGFEESAQKIKNRCMNLNMTLRGCS